MWTTEIDELSLRSSDWAFYLLSLFIDLMSFLFIDFL